MRKIPKEIKRNLNDKFREPHLRAMGTAEPLNSHVVWQMMNRKQTLTEWWHLLTFGTNPSLDSPSNIALNSKNLKT